jgi:hypothetical protein
VVKNISWLVKFSFVIVDMNAAIERTCPAIKTLWSHKKKRLKLEIVKVLSISKTHFSCPSCVQFYKLILNKKNVLEEIHSSDKYSTFMENLSDCNKCTCITSS